MRKESKAGQGALLSLSVQQQKIDVTSICDRYTHRQTQTARHMYR